MLRVCFRMRSRVAIVFSVPKLVLSFCSWASDTARVLFLGVCWSGAIYSYPTVRVASFTCSGIDKTGVLRPLRLHDWVPAHA